MKQIMLIVENQALRHKLRVWLSDPRWQLRVVRDGPSALSITLDSKGPGDLTILHVNPQEALKDQLDPLMTAGIFPGQLLVLMTQEMHETVKDDLKYRHLKVLYSPMGQAKIMAAVEMQLGLCPQIYEEE